jgi:hypothetical protein
MAKRVKYVFQDNDKIAHLWVGHNLSGNGQSEARNPQRNFYFSDDTIYSYGSHFPIARFVRNGKKQAIQFTTRGYSPTTSGHISTVRGAIQGNDIPVFHIYHATDTGGGNNLVDYVKRIDAAIEKQSKSRSTRNIAEYRATAVSLIEECRAYCRFWKIKTPAFPKVPKLPADFVARQKRERELQARRDEANRLEREVQRAQWLKDKAEAIAKYNAQASGWLANKDTKIAEWLAGGELNIPSRPYHYSEGYLLPGQTPDDILPAIELPTLLRIVGDEVETSRHASFPLSHAKRGLALVESCIARGENWEANGHTCKLGLYSISRIEITPNENGGAVIYAGCHVVPYSSVLLIRPEILAYQPKTEEPQQAQAEA